MQGRILTVTESDPCAGAGVQGDIKTAMAMGGYATTAITAVTVQNANSVSNVQILSGKLVAEQMIKAIDSMGVGVIKIGTLYNEDIINHVVDVLEEKRNSIKYIITDPEMIGPDGAQIMDKQTVDLYKRRLLVISNVITPNIREAELLTGMEITDIETMQHAADMLHTYGADSVILKGGDMISDGSAGIVVSDEGDSLIQFPMIGGSKIYGAGASISTSIAVSMARGMSVTSATEKALIFLDSAVTNSKAKGQPLNHSFVIGSK